MKTVEGQLPNKQATMDIERLKDLLDHPHRRWILVKLKKRYENGETRPKSARLDRPSPEETHAHNLLTGKTVSPGKPLTVYFEKLEADLQRTGACDSLRQAVEALTGPIVDQPKARAREANRWQSLFSSAQQRLLDRPEALDWLSTLQEKGLLKKIVRSDLATACHLLDHAIEVIGELPTTGVRLAELAARVTNDSHSLDRETPLGKLCLRYAAIATSINDLGDAQSWREIWMGVGVSCDDVSGPVLVLNLPATSNSLSSAILRLHARYGEPCRLTARQLDRHAPTFSISKRRRKIYICENPTVLVAAADRLGPSSAPMVCIDGTMKIAARILLTQLRDAGHALCYHGDFDWKGIQIGNSIIQGLGGSPWRYSVQDYLAIPGKVSLAGAPIAAAWDPDLTPAMEARGVAIYEEQVLDILMKDLAL